MSASAVRAATLLTFASWAAKPLKRAVVEKRAKN